MADQDFEAIRQAAEACEEAKERYEYALRVRKEAPHSGAAIEDSSLAARQYAGTQEVLGSRHAEIKALLADCDRAVALLAHLESWRDRAGNIYDLLNPEAQVQPIIGQCDALLSRSREWEAMVEAQRVALDQINGEVANLDRMLPHSGDLWFNHLMWVLERMRKALRDALVSPAIAAVRERVERGEEAERLLGWWQGNLETHQIVKAEPSGFVIYRCQPGFMWYHPDSAPVAHGETLLDALRAAAAEKEKGGCK